MNRKKELHGTFFSVRFTTIVLGLSKVCYSSGRKALTPVKIREIPGIDELPSLGCFPRVTVSFTSSCLALTDSQNYYWQNEIFFGKMSSGLPDIASSTMRRLLACATLKMRQVRFSLKKAEADSFLLLEAERIRFFSLCRLKCETPQKWMKLKKISEWRFFPFFSAK